MQTWLKAEGICLGTLSTDFIPNPAVKRTGLRPTAYFCSLVPSPVPCAHPPVPALRPVPKAFKPFGPPALVQQAPPAILLAVLRRFRGPAVFLGLRTSSRLGAPFWPSGLTLRSSGPAFCGPLTLAVSPITRFMRAATYFSALPCSKGLQAFLASSACAASATSYHACSAAPLSWPSGFSWAAPVFKAGRSLLAFGSNSAVKRTASPPLTLAVSLRKRDYRILRFACSRVG